jgi:signal transduction histidine kinase
MLQRDEEAPLNDRHRKMVDEAERSCARLVALIAEMSEVSKLDAGVTVLGKAPLDLFALIQELADDVHEAQERDVRFEVRGESSGAAMTGDAARLRSALNAVFRAVLREQPSACTVVAERRLDTRDGASSAVIVVAEHSAVRGAYESKPVAFDEKRGGLGLTVPLARRIIEGHGGHLWSPRSAAKRCAAIVSIPLRS